MVSLTTLKKLARENGTPLFVVDHAELRRNYATFKKYLPRVQAYYAVKANPNPEIVRTLFKAGASFDVASLPELRIVCENIKDLPAKKRQQWIWDKIIYANPIKANETLAELDHYNPLVTYDNAEEIRKMAVSSASAASDIKKILTNIRSETTKMVSTIQETSVLGETQATATQQISTAMVQLASSAADIEKVAEIVMEQCGK